MTLPWKRAAREYRWKARSERKLKRAERSQRRQAERREAAMRARYERTEKLLTDTMARLVYWQAHAMMATVMASATSRDALIPGLSFTRLRKVTPEEIRELSERLTAAKQALDERGISP